MGKNESPKVSKVTLLVTIKVRIFCGFSNTVKSHFQPRKCVKISLVYYVDRWVVTTTDWGKRGRDECKTPLLKTVLDWVWVLLARPGGSI